MGEFGFKSNFLFFVEGIDLIGKQIKVLSTPVEMRKLISHSCCNPLVLLWVSKNLN